MKEASYKIILLFFLFSICYSLNENKYIHKDIIPIDNCKHLFGVAIYENDNNINQTLSFQNWVSNNLFFFASLTPNKHSSDNYLSYMIDLGYKIDYNNKIFKNLIFDLGYNRLRFNNLEDNIKAISIGLSATFKSDDLFYFISYHIYDEVENYNSVSLNMLKIFKNKFFLKFGMNINFDKSDEFYVPYISLMYSI